MYSNLRNFNKKKAWKTNVYLGYNINILKPV